MTYGMATLRVRWAACLRCLIFVGLGLTLLGCGDDKSESVVPPVTPPPVTPPVTESLVETVAYVTPVPVGYDSVAWEDVHKVFFDFKHLAIEHPQSFTVEITLANALTEDQSFTGLLKGVPVSAEATTAQGMNITLSLNDPVYLDALRQGRVTLGIGRTGSTELLHIKKIKATLVAQPVEAEKDAYDLRVDSRRYVLGRERLHHQVAPGVVYAVSAVELGNTLSEGGMNRRDSLLSRELLVRYFDPKTKQWMVSVLASDLPVMVKTAGEMAFFVVGTNQASDFGVTITPLNGS
ncbi:hypothetical protein L4C36_10685 [Photobacterium japonica]|uniref:hypothetical protein n=1 Tax=Photobacterium japonica TaxID=2910235 RepID=UPI003D12B568